MFVYEILPQFMLFAVYYTLYHSFAMIKKRSAQRIASSMFMFMTGITLNGEIKNTYCSSMQRNKVYREGKQRRAAEAPSYSYH